MEDKNSTGSKSSPANSTELESSPVNREVYQEEATETTPGSDQGGSGGTIGTKLITVGAKVITEVKRKRGRPRKYDGAARMGSSSVLTPSGLSPSFSQTYNKRCRGRPKGSGKLQALASLGGPAMETAGGSFTPYVVTVPRGECLYRKIKTFALMGSRAICALSATGDVCSVAIRQPGSSGGILRFQGQFEILSLNGSLITNSMGRRVGELSISLAKPTGQVFGGKVAGSIIAACPIQLVVATFKQNILKELKKKQSAESSTAASVFSNLDMVRVPILQPSEPKYDQLASLVDSTDQIILHSSQPALDQLASLVDSSDQIILHPSLPASDQMESPVDSSDQNTLQPSDCEM